MVLEQEIKLVINTRVELDLSLLPCLSDLVKSPMKKDSLISTYYDTDDLDLSGNKLGLRLRQINESYLQTVKTAGTVKNGLHQREEWEYELVSPEWDLRTLKLTPLKSMIEDRDVWSKLAPLFCTEFIRETVQLTLADGTQVELAYDRGEVWAGKLSSPIHEIELELKSGDSEQLSILADLLRQQLDLSLSDVSKAQMGYELVARLRDK